MNKFLLWDFDGTLGCRKDGLYGRAWSLSMLEAIQTTDPLSSITVEEIAPFLKKGFPWHHPEQEHIHLNNGELWWAHIRHIFMNIYRQLGFSKIQAQALAVAAQARFLDLNTWMLYEDTMSVIQELSSKGWRHIIVSNHVPELPLIVEYLGLKPSIPVIVNSADVGYEKPNPKIFELALEHTSGAADVWMIGDNIVADVLGAEQVGI